MRIPSDEAAYSSPHNADLAKAEGFDQLFRHGNMRNGFVGCCGRSRCHTQLLVHGSVASKSTHPTKCSIVAKTPLVTGPPTASLEPGVFRFCLLQDGHVGVGVLPQHKKVLIRSPGFGGEPD